jgi:ABC-type branched-subunit amino acid transport system ATPase component
MALLEIAAISRRFGGLLAVDDVSFGVAKGEIVGVVGPNGAGKSTLFGIICGDIGPGSGEVWLAGERLTGLTSDRIARKGLVRTFQTPRPFTSMSFLGNVTVAALARTGDTAEARRRGERALEQVGLLGFRDNPANGASTGQRKRLDIARAIATEPRVLLLDEPLGGVDPGSIDEILGLLQRLRADGMTLVVIEHNLEALLRLADRFVAMTLGRKLAEGEPRQVMRDPRLVEAYLGGSAHEAA